MAKKKGKRARPLKVGLYVGSFNPLHEGHIDIINKAAMVFDKVIVAQALNPKEELPPPVEIDGDKKVHCITYDILTIELIEKIKPTAIIRGLRNVNDFVYEQAFQYMLEDHGLEVPITYFICDKSVVHYSSTMFRELNDAESRQKTKE